MNTGIKVHGHWIIEVLNPDGSLVNHREFENANSARRRRDPSHPASTRGDSRRVGHWTGRRRQPALQPLRWALSVLRLPTLGRPEPRLFIGDRADVLLTSLHGRDIARRTIDSRPFASRVPSAWVRILVSEPQCGCRTARRAGALYRSLPCVPSAQNHGFPVEGYAVAQQTAHVTLVETALMGCGSRRALACAASASTGRRRCHQQHAILILAAFAGTGASQLFTNFGSIFTGTYVPGHRDSGLERSRP